jgi:ferredoxin-NADP reductase
MSSQFALSSFVGRVVKSVVTPTVIDFWAAELGFDRRVERTICRVTARRMETADTVTLEVKPNSNFTGFRAGQHVNLSVDIDGIRHTRSYSFSAAPAATGRLAITIKKVPNGRVSGYLVDHLQIGDRIELGQAFGEMTFADGVPPKIVMLAAGSGVTPLMSLLRELTQQQMPSDVVFMFWVRTRADLIFREELEALAARYSQLRVVPVYEHETDLQHGDLSGRPCAEQFTDISDLNERSVYACGPTGFMNAVQALVGEQAQVFHGEAFTPPVFVPTSNETVRVFLRKSNKHVDLPQGMPLLDALEAQGIKPNSGCRMGICNTCACGKSGGMTRNLLTQELDVDDTANLRICVSAAVGDLTLDL